MQLPVTFRPSAVSMPPMYTWPRSLKRVLLVVLVFAVITAYLLLAGGLVAFLALMAQWVGG